MRGLFKGHFVDEFVCVYVCVAGGGGGGGEVLGFESHIKYAKRQYFSFYIEGF